jgi:transcriptional regulator with XRE-family HTH domain
MAINAHFEETDAADRPRGARRQLRLEAQGALASGGSTDVLVHNISATGLLLESPVALAIDERIGIDLPLVGATWASVIWVSGNLYGCQFDAPISTAALSAAQLRSAVEAPVDIIPAREGPQDRSFGARLQRLRKARGVSQAYIAGRLGVSKPTVWAWEHGKAHPIGSRMEALAEALGVPLSELQQGPATPIVDDLTSRSREQIAAAIGTSPENVRIWVEL